MKFIAQTIQGDVIHDFVFGLLRAREFFNWKGEELEVRLAEMEEFLSMDEPGEWIPVGSVQFVSRFIEKFYPEARKALLPLNVPMALFRFAGNRHVQNILDVERAASALSPGETVFRKSLARIKDPANGLFTIESPEDVIGFQISHPDEFLSEWRAFVFHGKIQFVANYAGDPLLFPDADRVRMMVKSYGDDAPVAYTLDVAVNSNRQTVVVECHRFFSCGLYGFNDYATLPYMLSQEWFELKNLR